MQAMVPSLQLLDQLSRLRGACVQYLLCDRPTPELADEGMPLSSHGRQALPLICSGRAMGKPSQKQLFQGTKKNDTHIAFVTNFSSWFLRYCEKTLTKSNLGKERVYLAYIIKARQQPKAGI